MTAKPGVRPRNGTIGAVAITATYVSTIVGAGFASGQEVLRFFTHFGVRGLVGLAVATVFLAVCGMAIMLESRACRARSHGDLLRWLGGPVFARIYDVVITAFLFGTTAVMVAGSGAFFQEQLGLPTLLGDIVMAVAAVATVLAGIRGVVAASEVVVPFLVAAVVLIAVLAVRQAGPLALLRDGVWRVWSRPAEAACSSWTLAAFLYVAYNLVLAPAVLTPLAARAGSRRALVVGGTVGGLLLGFAAACVNVALLAGLPGSAGYEVPMLHVAANLGGTASAILRPVCGLVLWAEIYTTAVGLLYGFALRLAGRGEAGGLAFRRWVVAGGVAATLASRAGFSNMVITLYPAVGYAGLAFIAVVLVRLVSVRRRGPSGRGKGPG